MSKTNFSATALINNLAGNLKGDPANPDWAAIEKQFKLIESEFSVEMREHIANRDIVALRDDIGDVLFTTYGMGHRAGFPVDLDYAEVCRSNMSKFDRSEEDALKTKAKYDALGVETVYKLRIVEMEHEMPGNSPSFFQDEVFYVTYSAKDQNGNDPGDVPAGKFKYPAGKWLKSFRFEEPKYVGVAALGTDIDTIATV